MVILEEETFEKFGYYSGELSRRTTKPILAACDNCGKVRVTSKHDYRLLCRQCATQTEFKMGRIPYNKGLHLSETTKEKIQKTLEGKHTSPKTEFKKGKMSGESNPFYGKHHTEQALIKMSESHKGKKSSEETRKLRRKICIKLWQDQEFVKMMMAARHTKPNKLEKLADTVLQTISPNEWIYNGDFSQRISLAGMIPDFVNRNGKKGVIEVFGVPWHDSENTFLDKIDWKRTEWGKKSTYSQLGYKCAILWEYELKKDDAVETVLKKLKEEGLAPP